MTEAKGKAVSDGGAKDRPWELRLWAGMTMKAWFGLLYRNRFHVSPSRIPMVAMSSGISVFNSFLRCNSGCSLAGGLRVANWLKIRSLSWATGAQERRGCMS